MVSTFGILDLNTPDLLILLALALLIFGGKKLPELSRSLGQSVKELRSGFNDSSADKTASNEKKSESA